MRFIVQDPDSFNENFAVTLKKSNTILIALFLILFFSVLVYFVISYTSIKKLIPGYPKNGDNVEYITSKTSELENENKNRELWIKNLQEILTNNDSIHLRDIIDTLTIDSTIDYKNIFFERPIEDSLLRIKIKNYNELNQNTVVKSLLTSALEFKKPYNNKIIRTNQGEINQATYKAKRKTPIKASMDGIIVSKTKRTLILQHSNNFISIYKNCKDINGKIGEELEKGNEIGFAADSVFHFQIWYKGNSVPVETYQNL